MARPATWFHNKIKPETWVSLEFPSVSPWHSQELREGIWVTSGYGLQSQHSLCQGQRDSEAQGRGLWFLYPQTGSTSGTRTQEKAKVLSPLCPHLRSSLCWEESWVGLLLLLSLWRLVDVTFTGKREWLIKGMGSEVRLNWIELQVGFLFAV